LNKLASVNDRTQLLSTDIHIIFTVGQTFVLFLTCLYIYLRTGNQLEQIGLMLPELFMFEVDIKQHYDLIIMMIFTLLRSVFLFCFFET